MHAGYIVDGVLYVLIAVPVFVLSLINFHSGYYRYARDTSPVIRALLLFNALGAMLLVVRAIDPDGCFFAYHESIRQWVSVNTTSIILSAAALWLVQLFGSVSRLGSGGSNADAAAANGKPQPQASSWRHTGLAVVIIGEFATANIGCAIGQSIDRYWPTSVFLVTSAALMFFLFGVLTYSAHYVRAAIHRARRMHVHAGSDGLSKLNDALRRLNVVHVLITVLLVTCGIVNLVVFVGRVRSTQSFSEALTCTDPEVFDFDILLWAQVLALACLLMYTWQPLPACGGSSSAAAPAPAVVRVRVRGQSYDGEQSGEDGGTGDVTVHNTIAKYATSSTIAAGSYQPPAPTSVAGSYV